MPGFSTLVILRSFIVKLVYPFISLPWVHHWNIGNELAQPLELGPRQSCRTSGENTNSRPFEAVRGSSGPIATVLFGLVLPQTRWFFEGSLGYVRGLGHTPMVLRKLRLYKAVRWFTLRWINFFLATFTLDQLFLATFMLDQLLKYLYSLVDPRTASLTLGFLRTQGSNVVKCWPS